MTNDDFKKLLDESVKPIQDDLKEVKGGLNNIQDDLKKVKSDLKKVQEDQVDLRKIVEERVLPPLTYIENTVKSYADRYVTNEDHIRRLQKRVGTVEDKLGIYPPEDLTIPSIE